MILNSIIIPAYNEYNNLIELLDEIEKEFVSEIEQRNIEVIIINDGSNDETRSDLIKIIKTKKTQIKIVHLIKNQGKHFALEKAFNYINGENIVIIDADQQYKIKDIKKLISVLDKGYDLVNGKRNNRKDDNLTNTASKIYNFIIRTILNVECEDFFSGLKVFKSKIIKVINFRDLCRFIILLAKINGFKICEEDIDHSERIHGKSRYNFFSRLKLSINDLITIFFLKFANKYRIYIINIYSRFALALYFLLKLINIILDKNYLLSDLYNDKIIVLLILLNFVGIIFSSIIKLHEMHHNNSFQERMKNFDTVQSNYE